MIKDQNFRPSIDEVMQIPYVKKYYTTEKKVEPKVIEEKEEVKETPKIDKENENIGVTDKTNRHKCKN
jgi:hypothetical protein